MNQTTINNALKYFRVHNEHKISASERKEYQSRIKQSGRPLATAKAIIKELDRDRLNSYKTSEKKRKYDHSDVLEIEVQAIRKFMWLEPLQEKWLSQMNRLATQRKLTSTLFAELSQNVLEFTPTTTPSFRKKEQQYEREA